MGDLTIDAAAHADACAAFSALGDAVALLDLRSRSLRWTSPAWLSLQPALVAGTPLPAIERALPGLAAARIAAPLAAASRVRVGVSLEWELELAPFDGAARLMRLTDRREQSRVVQRQLDDREQLLFTSRVISVGEMAAVPPRTCCAACAPGWRAAPRGSTPMKPRRSTARSSR